MASFLSSSIGKKLIMAIAGLFLISFLLLHLGINLLLIIFEDTKNFNLAANFMATNIIIKFFEVILFAFFLIHIFYGIYLQIQNWISRPVAYSISNNEQLSFFSKYMIHTAAAIFVFLIMHLFDFYFKAKVFGGLEEVVYNGKVYPDMASLVIAKFSIGWVIIAYIAAFIFLGFHLLHGFQSAFHSLGLNHKKYTPVIKLLGIAYTVIVVSGFALIPLFIYFTR